MRKQWLKVFGTVLLLLTLLLGSCGQAVEQSTEKHTEDKPEESVSETESENDSETETDEMPKNIFDFDGSVSEATLRAYLSRAVTISTTLDTKKSYIKNFILDVGAKYICRAATCWSPSASDYDTYGGQKTFINAVHRSDSDVVFEACLFECVNKKGVGSIPIPAWVFEAFEQPVEERNFDYDKMVFENGQYKDQWGTDSSVPDMTRLETMMFFYYRACKYIDTGYEALHMGQVYLMGRNDKKWEHYTELTGMIRDYASTHARRHFVFLNAHVKGIIDADGYLMFDFHMWPSRLYSGEKDAEGNEVAYVRVGHVDSIYGMSMGGLTHSGWTCKHLPYLVELDNFGDSQSIGSRTPDTIYVWGYDEITWFANQSDAYREEFILTIIDQVRTVDEDGYFALPGERVARIYDSEGNIVRWAYYAYDKSQFKDGFGDQAAIKEAFASREIGD